MPAARVPGSRLRSIPFQAVTAGLLACFVGFASSFAIILKALLSLGASQAQAASGLMALSVAMGVAGILLSAKTRMPVSVAWSTPGAALLIASGPVEGGFPAAVGAFLLTGVLLLAAGLWKPFGRAVAAIPAPLANAMLAGIVFGLCLAPVRAVAEMPKLALPVILVWALAAKVKRVLAMPAAVIALLIAIFLSARTGTGALGTVWPQAEFVWPQFGVPAFFGLALPLFLVTMAAQNIPGLAVLNANGYKPDTGPLVATTGVFTLLAACFGGIAVNLAAITAAICAGDEAGPDRSLRYWSPIVCGAGYVVFGLFASAAAAIVSAAPPVLIEAVAGLALLGALGSAMFNMVCHAQDRDAAVITFLVTASGQAFFGLGGAFWGLAAGGAMLLLSRWRPG